MKALALLLCFIPTLSLADEDTQLRQVCPSGCVMISEETARKIETEVAQMRAIVALLVAEYEREERRKATARCI